MWSQTPPSYRHWLNWKKQSKGLTLYDTECACRDKELSGVHRIIEGGKWEGKGNKFLIAVYIHCNWIFTTCSCLSLLTSPLIWAVWRKFCLHWNSSMSSYTTPLTLNQTPAQHIKLTRTPYCSGSAYTQQWTWESEHMHMYMYAHWEAHEDKLALSYTLHNRYYVMIMVMFTAYGYL